MQGCDADAGWVQLTLTTIYIMDVLSGQWCGGDQRECFSGFPGTFQNEKVYQLLGSIFKER